MVIVKCEYMVQCMIKFLKKPKITIIYGEL